MSNLYIKMVGKDVFYVRGEQESFCQRASDYVQKSMVCRDVLN
jgi:hypothetical protein